MLNGPRRGAGPAVVQERLEIGSNQGFSLE